MYICDLYKREQDVESCTLLLQMLASTLSGRLRSTPYTIARIPSTGIREVDIGVSADNSHVAQTMLLTPLEHLVKRQTTEPICDRSGIVLHEAPRTAMILGIGSGIVLGVVLPEQMSLERLTSKRADVVELIDHGLDLTLDAPNGVRIFAVLIVLGDDVANRHSVSFLTLCSVIMRYCSHGQNIKLG